MNISAIVKTAVFPVALGAIALALSPTVFAASEPSKPVPPNLVINGEGPGWRALSLADFEPVNVNPDTFTEKEGTIYNTGKPVGVARSKFKVTNFEMVLEWRHMKSAGNAGVFLWIPDEFLQGLKPDSLPKCGIEVQILDHGYTEEYEKSSGKKADWFTTNGDVFPVGSADMNPFPPSGQGKRSFPTKNLSKGIEQWNHYYIRAINGEVRLWVNGEEVSGGNGCTPATGFIALESEGSPMEIKNMRIRELP